MKNNTIFNPRNENEIGYYEDLSASLRSTIEDYIKANDWESIKDLVDLLMDLNEYQNNENLLVIVNHNGMGYSIKEYEKGD